MSQTTGPYPLVDGGSVQVAMPSSAPWESVVLSNISPYLLQISGGAGTQWLTPWTENVYVSPASHNPFSVSAQLPAGTSPSAEAGSQLQATWYAPGETPQGAWPIPLIANALTAAIAGLNFDANGNLNINVNAIESTPPLVGSLFTHSLTMEGSGTPVQGPNQAVLRGVTMVTLGDNVTGVGLGASSGSQPVGIAPGAWGPALPVTNCDLLWFEGHAGDVIVLIGV